MHIDNQTLDLTQLSQFYSIVVGVNKQFLISEEKKIVGLRLSG